MRYPTATHGFCHSNGCYRVNGHDGPHADMDGDPIDADGIRIIGEDEPVMPLDTAPALKVEETLEDRILESVKSSIESGSLDATMARALNEDATEGAKSTNPKDAVSSKKARWFSYLPLRVLYGVGMAMFEGARKYGRHNYRVAGVRGTVYVDAAICGHLTPWMEGQDIDPESGAHHIDKAIASLMILRDGIYEGNWVDDRPPSVKDWDGFIAGQNATAEALIDRHPDPKTPFTIKDTVR